MRSREVDARPGVTPTGMDIPALAARAQLGDAASLDKLLRLLQQPLFDHARHILGDEDRAADVLQETMLSICRHLGAVRDVAWTRAWAFRIATRLSWRATRRHAATSRHVPIHECHELPVEDDGDGAADAGLLAEIPTRLESLPPAAQVVLRLHYVEGLT
jgi:RNA polymerase sigma-70 factor, ECF subfamily